MNNINVKTVWYLLGGLLLGLFALVVSCGMIESPSPPPPVATIVPPVIPHSIEGRADCRACHATGVGGAPQFPASHSERPSDVCLACHTTAAIEKGEGALMTKPAPPVETTPTAKPTPKAVSATQLFSSRCAACHGVNRQGVPGLAPALTPKSLAALNDTEIRDAVLDGRPGTAMPAFKGTLSPEEIDALLQLIKHTAP